VGFFGGVCVILIWRRSSLQLPSVQISWPLELSSPLFPWLPDLFLLLDREPLAFLPIFATLYLFRRVGLVDLIGPSGRTSDRYLCPSNWVLVSLVVLRGGRCNVEAPEETVILLVWYFVVFYIIVGAYVWRCLYSML
jgi:hypothetical protein